MGTQWCRETLDETLGEHGTPEILNINQESQFTVEGFANHVLCQDIRLSMDCKGRAMDNALIERLWRNMKYEKKYLIPPRGGMDLYLLLAEYFDYYNHQRRHQSIDYERAIDLFKRAA